MTRPEHLQNSSAHNEQLSETIASLKERLKATEAQKEALERSKNEEIAALTENLGDLRNLKARIEASTAADGIDKEHLEIIAQLQERLRVAEAQKEALENSKNGEIAVLTENLVDLRNLKAKLEASPDTSDQQHLAIIEELKAKLRESEAQREALENSKNEEIAVLTDNLSDLRSLKTKLDNIESAGSISDQEHAKLVSELEEKLKRSEEQNEALEESKNAEILVLIEELKTQKERSSNFSTLAEENQNLAAENQDLKSKLNDAESSLKRSLEEMRDQSSDSEAQLEKMTSANEHANAQSSELKLQLEKANERSATLLQELQTIAPVAKQVEPLKEELKEVLEAKSLEESRSASLALSVQTNQDLLLSKQAIQEQLNLELVDLKLQLEKLEEEIKRVRQAAKSAKEQHAVSVQALEDEHSRAEGNLRAEVTR